MHTISRWICILIGFHLSLAEGSAADHTMEAQIPLKTPRQKAPRMGGAKDKLEIAIFIPDGVKHIRGAVVNPYYVKTVEQKHWQEAARLWDFAVIGANFFGVKQTEFGSTLQAGLETFAERSKHPELAHIPMCFVGMSAGGGMSVRMSDEFPDRTIAAGPVCLEVGPRSEATRKIPIVTIFGERDGRQLEKLMTRLPEERADGAQWAIAIQWNRRHEFHKANNIVVPWFDHVIRSRYPADGLPLKKPVALKTLTVKDGWLGSVEDWKTKVAEVNSWEKFSGDKNRACWFPDAYVAHTWQAFVNHKPQVKLTAPPGLGGGQPFLLHEPNKPIEVTFQVDKKKVGEIDTIQIWDGDHMVKSLKEVSAVPVSLGSGIHALRVQVVYSDGSMDVSHPNTILVRKK